MATYRLALEHQPGLAYVRNKLAAALAVAGRYDDGLDESRRAVKMRPGSSFIHEGHGWVLFLTGRYDEAEAAYRRAIHLRPGIGSYHSGLGQALTEQGRMLESAEVHRGRWAEAVGGDLRPPGPHAGSTRRNRRGPRRRPPGGGLATGVVGRTQQPSPTPLPPTARSVRPSTPIGKLIALAPRDAGLWWRLGKLLRSENKLDEAAAVVLEAIRRGPNRARLAVTYNELGLIRDELGQRDLAVAAYHKALGQSPATP